MTKTYLTKFQKDKFSNSMSHKTRQSLTIVLCMFVEMYEIQ